MENTLKKDPRKNVSGDLKQRYDDYQSYKESKIARDSLRVLDLLPTTGDEIQVRDIKQALINKYGMEDSYTDKVIKEVGTQFKDVRCRRNSYSHSRDNSDIYMRRTN